MFQRLVDVESPFRGLGISDDRQASTDHRDRRTELPAFISGQATLIHAKQFSERSLT